MIIIIIIDISLEEQQTSLNSKTSSRRLNDSVHVLRLGFQTSFYHHHHHHHVLCLDFQTSYHHHLSLHCWIVWGHPHNDIDEFLFLVLIIVYKTILLHLASILGFVLFLDRAEQQAPILLHLGLLLLKLLFVIAIWFPLIIRSVIFLFQAPFVNYQGKVLPWLPRLPRYLVVISKIIFYPGNNVLLVLSWPGSCVHPWLTCPPCLSARRSERGRMTKNHLMLYIQSDHLRLARFSWSSDTTI